MIDLYEYITVRKENAKLKERNGQLAEENAFLVQRLKDADNDAWEQKAQKLGAKFALMESEEFANRLNKRLDIAEKDLDAVHKELDGLIEYTEQLEQQLKTTEEASGDAINTLQIQLKAVREAGMVEMVRSEAAEAENDELRATIEEQLGDIERLYLEVDALRTASELYAAQLSSFQNELQGRDDVISYLEDTNEGLAEEVGNLRELRAVQDAAVRTLASRVAELTGNTYGKAQPLHA